MKKNFDQNQPNLQTDLENKGIRRRLKTI